MRHYFTIIAAFFAVFAFMTVSTTAQASVHSTHARVTCSEKWTGYIGPPNPGNASVAWSANTCGHQVRVAITCSGGGSPVNRFGGWVRTVGLHYGC
jgi:hypothetical protein